MSKYTLEIEAETIGELRAKIYEVCEDSGVIDGLVKDRAIAEAEVSAIVYAKSVIDNLRGQYWANGPSDASKALDRSMAKLKEYQQTLEEHFQERLGENFEQKMREIKDGT